MRIVYLTLLGVALAGGFLWAQHASKQPFTPERAVHGKPNAAVGWLEVSIVERPSADRAWIRAVWTRGYDAQNCRLLFLPGEGGTILEGEADVALDADADGGEALWLVDFPTNRDLDAVIRLCAQTYRGLHACEAYAPLVRTQ